MENNWDGVERREHHRREEFNHNLEQVIESTVSKIIGNARIIDCDTHAEHHEFIKLAIEKQKQSIELRKAVIEKTLTGLIYSFILFLVGLVVTFIRAGK
jgi:hypothetical protein